jgi:hypothetical protein
VEQTVCSGACESVAESAQGEDGWVEEAGVRLDVESGEEGGSLVMESFERREGWIGVG